MLLSVALGTAARGQNVQFVPVINTVAGVQGSTGSSGNGGSALSAQLSSAVDATTTDEFGNLYISDTGNNVIRRVDAVTGVISIVAGGGTTTPLCANPVATGSAATDTFGEGCPATQATLNAPKAVRFYKGDMYIADSGDNLVRVVSGTTGIIAPFAGNTKALPAASGGTALNSPVRSPQDILFDSAGDLFVIVAGGMPSVIELSAATNLVTIVAGNSVGGKSGDGGPATSAMLAAPFGLALDSAGDLFISEGNNNDVRKVVFPSGPASGIITTYAGSTGTTPGYTGVGGPSNLALLNSPEHIFIDSSNNLYIADRVNNRVVEVSAPAAGAAYGILNTIAGSGLMPYGAGDGGPAAVANLNGPLDVELTNAGDLLITDAGDAKVRAVRPTGMFANTAVGASVTQTVYAKVIQAITVGASGFSIPAGYPDFSVAASPNCAANAAVAAGTICSVAVTFTPTMAGQRRAPLVFTDAKNNIYSEQLIGVGIAPAAALLPGTIATIAGTGTAGNTGNPAAGTSAQLNKAAAVAVDGQGNTFLADTANNQVREIAAGTGVITTVAGTGAAGAGGDGGAATAATLTAPAGVAVDGAGNLYIADTGNQRIRLVSATTGLISTYAGTGAAGYSGDGGLASAAQLNAPAAVALTPGGLLLIADTGNNVIRAVGLRSGTISTFAGTFAAAGAATFGGDQGQAVNAQLNGPAGVAVDNANVVYISDTGNNRIRSVANDIISTLAGTTSAVFNQDGPAASAALTRPTGLTVDAAQNVYFADTGNNRIREISGGQVITVAGSATQGYTGDGGSATSAALNAPMGVALDGKGNLVLADTGNSVVRSVNVAAATIGFPTTSPNTTSSAVSVLLNNIGNQPLAVSGITFPGSFADSPGGTTTDCNGSGVKVAAGSSCQLSLVFSPAATGSYSGNVTVSDNAQAVATAQQTIAVSAVSAYVFTGSATLPKTSTAGVNTAFALTVSNPMGTYTGTVHLTSSDPQAVLPANYTFLPTDNGMHTFQVQLRTTGIQTVTATDTLNPTITATASTNLVAGAAAKLVAISGSGQSAKILATFGSPLTVEAFDAFNNPASGVSVTFTAPATGAAATFAGTSTATVATGLSGTASSPLLTANAFTGSFTVQATAAGVTTPLSFSLSNTSPSAAALAVSSNPTTLTISPGGSGTIPIIVQSSGGLSTPIQFTCSTPDASLTCQFSLATLSPSATGASTMTTLTVTSQASMSQLIAHPVRSFGKSSGAFLAAIFPLGLLVFTRRRTLRGIMLLLCLAALLGAAGGCGSGTTTSSSTHPGSYSIVVTGTSGSLTSSTTVLCYVTGYPAGN